jgi:glycosyltransferase involved in cell wall biosynthesis
LKEPGPVGELLAAEIPVHHHVLRKKYDLRVWPRLVRLFRERQVDAVVTVGAGDKMFWGRLAAWRADVPVIVAALHSTGWPDGVGRLNRWLTPLTDAFVAVAESHGRFLVETEKFPRERVIVIPNGVDTDRFAPVPDAESFRQELSIGPTDPVVTIVAALRPEKNHAMFLRVARRIADAMPMTRFLIVGDGPCRIDLESQSHQLQLSQSVQFLGSRDDVPRILTASDVFVLTSHNEANPVSILEAMSIGRPVVATNVGSIHEVLDEDRTGQPVPPGDEKRLAQAVLELLRNPLQAKAMGAAARESVLRNWSLAHTVRGYETMIEKIYHIKADGRR